jgi:hypothetical protein
MAQALLASTALFAIAKTTTMLQNTDVPIEIQFQTAATLGASKIVASSLGDDFIMNALASGSLFAGAMYLTQGSDAWIRWMALGTACSLLADSLLPSQNTREPE